MVLLRTPSGGALQADVSKSRMLRELAEVDSDTTEVHVPLSSRLLERAFRWPDADMTEATRADLDAVWLAADYLDMPDLVDGIAQEHATRLAGLSVQAMRDYLGVVDDFSPAEKMRMLEETRWDFRKTSSGLGRSQSPQEP